MSSHRIPKPPCGVKPKMRWQIKNAIDDNPNIPSKERNCIKRLWWHGGDHGVAFPFQATVAKATGCTRRTVIRAVAVAVENHWLRVERRGKRSAEYIWAWSERFEVTEMSPEMSPQEAPAPYISESGVNVAPMVGHNPALEIPEDEPTVKDSLEVPTIRDFRTVRPRTYLSRPYDEYREAFRLDLARMRHVPDTPDHRPTPG